MANEITIQRGMWQRFIDYCREVKVEMRRVTWPGKQEVYGTTVMVLLTTFAFAAFFYVCDQSFSRLVLKVLDYLTHRAA
ncbi:MAG TPA: preprotein translocase subunit SecE [Terriglobia bacterium]|nr:preprotein translocase subunit SecE [Puia sp.]HEV2418441.1 preprotein translocase subunit SecE [Terriglobia bacterium]